MKVLVDTSVWSLVLRRQAGEPGPWATELRHLIEEMRVQIIGPIRQEILSGIRIAAQFEILKTRLRGFPDLPLQREDYERGAFFYNLCRARGIQGSNTDFLICAAAERNHLPIFTTDEDFRLFARHLPVKIHKIRHP